MLRWERVGRGIWETRLVGTVCKRFCVGCVGLMILGVETHPEAPTLVVAGFPFDLL